MIDPKDLMPSNEEVAKRLQEASRQNINECLRVAFGWLIGRIIATRIENLNNQAADYQKRIKDHFDRIRRKLET